MATDATGTPTSLGIPTYNVNVDAPTGNGFNAAMGSIDTLLKARIVDPSTQNDGEPLVWDSVGKQWIPVHVKINDVTKYLRGDGTWAAIGATIPTGALIQYAAAAAPTGFLLCDGSPISRTGQAALFSVIGTSYGAGDGSTTFNVPDLRGRVPVGLGTNAAVNALGLNDGVSAANRRPQHRHTAHNHGLTVYYQSSGSLAGQDGLATAAGAGIGAIYNTTSDTSRIAGTDGGSGLVNDSLDAPAYLIVNYIIKT